MALAKHPSLPLVLVALLDPQYKHFAFPMVLGALFASQDVLSTFLVSFQDSQVKTLDLHLIIEALFDSKDKDIAFPLALRLCLPLRANF